MGRNDLVEHIESKLEDHDGTTTKVSADIRDGRDETEVAIQKLVCTECGSVNGREPRPLDVPDVGKECPECGEITTHEYIVDSEVTTA